MCVCICVYIYVCICVYIYIYIYICTCMCMSLSLSIYIYIYTHTYVYTHIRTYVRMYVRTYVHMCVHIKEQASSTACMRLGKLLQNAHPYMKTLAAQSNALCLLVRQPFPHSFCIEPFSKLTAALSQSLFPSDQIGMHLIS